MRPAPHPLHLFALLASCAGAAAPSPPPAAALPSASRPVSDCPAAPAVELHALTGTELGDGFRVGGHIVSLAVEQGEDDPTVTLVGELDVKGTRAFEERTRALALASYAAGRRGADAGRMALALRGRVVGVMEVPSAMRGRRFRVRALTEAEGGAFTGATGAELADALRADRRCFAGREAW